MNKKAPTNLQREKIHGKDCDMLSNVGIPSAQKDESYCTCVKTLTHSPTETEEVSTCRWCGYELTEAEVNSYSGLCYQCFLDQDSPDQETLERRY